MDGRLSTLETGQYGLTNRVDRLAIGQQELRKDMVRGVAAAIAISSTSYMPEDGFGVSAGYGNYQGASEAAFGMSFRRGKLAVKGTVARDSMGAGVMVQF